MRIVAFLLLSALVAIDAASFGRSPLIPRTMKKLQKWLPPHSASLDIVDQKLRLTIYRELKNGAGAKKLCARDDRSITLSPRPFCQGSGDKEYYFLPVNKKEGVHESKPLQEMPNLPIRCELSVFHDRFPVPGNPKMLATVHYDVKFEYLGGHVIKSDDPKMRQPVDDQDVKQADSAANEVFFDNGEWDYSND